MKKYLIIPPTTSFYCIPNVACCVVIITTTPKNSTIIFNLPTKMICFWLNLLNNKKYLISKKKICSNCFVETCRIGTTLVWNGIRVILEVWKVLGFTHQDYGLQICWCITGTVYSELYVCLVICWIIQSWNSILNLKCILCAFDTTLDLKV